MKDRQHSNLIFLTRQCKACGGPIHRRYRDDRTRYCEDCWRWHRIGLHQQAIAQLLQEVRT